MALLDCCGTLRGYQHRWHEALSSPPTHLQSPQLTILVRLCNKCPTHWYMFLSLHICLINPSILVITAFTLDQNQDQDFGFQSADFEEIGTNIVRNDVPSAVIPGRLLRDAQPVPGLGLAPVQIPVAFTVTRNAELYLPRTLNNGRYSRRCGGVGGTEACVGACMGTVLSPRSLTYRATYVGCIGYVLCFHPLPSPAFLSLSPSVTLQQAQLDREHSQSQSKLALEMESLTHLPCLTSL